MTDKIVYSLKAFLLVGTVWSSVVNSASLSLLGGTPGQTSTDAGNSLVYTLFGTNDPIYGAYGAQVQLSGPATIEFAFWGWEAAYVNKFGLRTSSSTDVLFQKNTSVSRQLPADANTPLDSIEMDVTPITENLVDFFFESPEGTVFNGNNPVTGGVNFFATWRGDSLFLFLDDSPFRNPDDNHDDLVVSMRVVPIQTAPLPSSLILFCSALAGMIGVTRRRRRKRLVGRALRPPVAICAVDLKTVHSGPS